MAAATRRTVAGLTVSARCGEISGDRDRCGRQRFIAPFLTPVRKPAPQAGVGAAGGRGPGSCGRGPDACGVRLGQHDLGGVVFGDFGVASGDGSGQRFAPFGVFTRDR